MKTARLGTRSQVTTSQSATEVKIGIEVRVSGIPRVTRPDVKHVDETLA